MLHKERRLWLAGNIHNPEEAGSIWIVFRVKTSPSLNVLMVLNMTLPTYIVKTNLRYYFLSDNYLPAGKPDLIFLYLNMLPVHKAISYEGLMAGGSTHPWLVLVEQNQRFRPYVAKLYDYKYVTEKYFIAKEVYSSILASQFGIKTPAPVLIEFTPSFIARLQVIQRKALIGKHTRVTFGTEIIDGSFQFDMDVQRDYMWKYDIETVYAFDNLIKNADRRPTTPNILMKARDLYVIDHEQTFAVNSHTLNQFDEGIWVYWKDNHIFYRFLRERGVEAKRGFFHNFLNLLNRVDFGILDSYFEQLELLGLDDYQHYSELKDYLVHMQRNSGKFVQMLRGELG